MFYIGCHLSKKKGMLIMAEAAASIGAKAIQFFTRNPRGGHEKAIDPRDLQRFNVFTKEHGTSTSSPTRPIRSSRRAPT